MPDDAQALQHDITLLERAIWSASEMLAPGLLSEADGAAVRAEIAKLESTIVALYGRRDLVR